jgi:hypothetical protein
LTGSAHTVRCRLLLDERVAQLVEHLTFNQEVPGSSPGALTNKINDLANYSPSRGLQLGNVPAGVS